MDNPPKTTNSQPEFERIDADIGQPGKVVAPDKSPPMLF